MRFKTLVSVVVLCCSFFAQAKEYKLHHPAITIEPPAGFTESQNFTGFEQLETFTTIVISENEQPFSSAIAAQLGQNLQTLESQNVTIGTKEGILLKIEKNQSNTTFHQWLLLFGDQLGHVKVVASYPATMSKAIGPILKQTLLGIKPNRITKEQLFQNLPFHVKGDISPLVYQTRTANSVVMINKAPYDEASSYPPTYIISHDEMPKPIEDIIAFAQDKLNNKLFAVTKILTQKPITIAGVRSYLITAQAKHKKTGAPVLFYQTVSVNDSRYLIVQAIAPIAEQNFYLSLFNHITNSIAFKVAAR